MGEAPLFEQRKVHVNSVSPVGVHIDIAGNSGLKMDSKVVWKMGKAEMVWVPFMCLSSFYTHSWPRRCGHATAHRRPPLAVRLEDDSAAQYNVPQDNLMDLRCILLKNNINIS